MYEYPFGNDQRLNLDWFLAEWKNLLAAWEAEKNGIDGALDAEIARAEAALSDVFAARDAAAQSAADADASERAAAQSASDASGYLATVRADANAAQDAARNAAQSESNAADSAQTAVASKNAAGQSERNAAQSEANALASKNAAAQSVSDADASKSAAAQSEANALASKNAAAQSASDAEDAAESVEASAQQITTNTNDISNLKESITQITPTQLWAKASAKIADYNSTIGGRKLVVKQNYLSVDYASTVINRVIVLTNAIRISSSTLSAYTPIMEDLVDIATYPTNSIIQSYVARETAIDGIASIYVVFAKVENNTITKLSANTLVALNRNTGFVSEIVPNVPEDATHYALIYYSANSSLKSTVIYNFVNKDPNITALQATVLENMGG